MDNIASLRHTVVAFFPPWINYEDAITDEDAQVLVLQSIAYVA
jgi:hypothetical protein